MNETARQIPDKAAEYINVLREHLPRLRESYSVDTVGIFGSYVRGQEQEGSDLDVLVEFTLTPGLFDFVALKIELSELLGVNVDLVMKRALKPRIGERILREVVPV